MKTSTAITAMALPGLLALSAPVLAQGQLSANIGYASEYYYRGIFQNESSASAGLDYALSEFSLGETKLGKLQGGVWAADVGDGVEVDVYGSYAFAVEAFEFSVGFTNYYYTGEFDDTYKEINLGASWGPVSAMHSIGDYQNFSGPELDYTFSEIKYQHSSGAYARYGSYSDDFDGEFVELGYGTTISEIDLGIVLIVNSKEISDQSNSSGNATQGEALIFTLGKQFDL
ncbi:hypothetical protein NO559_07045 [Dasania sp. GY-MA-18]|uniref:Uncharacterized protein n=1 Tax=Dasania phycosphaerae TaxID=2950436 RepID=A0A9J6RL89_9GAMM|nr:MULTISPECIES: TorF family putative porin [Dasania]MCR8922523.1 hypothetical protein [Dasania sp. GY-MA-18]MCZ0864951.1 hypothetical protein [Dasania phycosphaerae]MCZ0868679.1 hypothetical protein [Dasania phycosphaerae]